MKSSAAEKTETVIRDILAQECSVDPDNITSNAHLVDDLGLDSLDKVEFFMSLESKFEIEIPDDVIEETHTFQQVVAYIEQRKHS